MQIIVSTECNCGVFRQWCGILGGWEWHRVEWSSMYILTDLHDCILKGDWHLFSTYVFFKIQNIYFEFIAFWFVELKAIYFLKKDSFGVLYVAIVLNISIVVKY